MSIDGERRSSDARTYQVSKRFAAVSAMALTEPLLVLDRARGPAGRADRVPAYAVGEHDTRLGALLDHPPSIVSTATCSGM